MTAGNHLTQTYRPDPLPYYWRHYQLHGTCLTTLKGFLMQERATSKDAEDMENFKKEHGLSQIFVSASNPGHILGGRFVFRPKSGWTLASDPACDGEGYYIPDQETQLGKEIAQHMTSLTEQSFARNTAFYEYMNALDPRQTQNIPIDPQNIYNCKGLHQSAYVEAFEIKEKDKKHTHTFYVLSVPMSFVRVENEIQAKWYIPDGGILLPASKYQEWVERAPNHQINPQHKESFQHVAQKQKKRSRSLFPHRRPKLELIAGRNF